MKFERKRTGLTGGAMLVAALLAAACGREDPDPAAVAALPMVPYVSPARPALEALALTDLQRAQLLPIWAEEERRVDALRRAPRLGRREKDEELRTIQAETRAKAERVLTPEQRERLAGRKADPPAAGAAGPGAAEPPASPAGAGP